MGGYLLKSTFRHKSLLPKHIIPPNFADDGLIDEADLREVMKACMVENGMEFDEKEVSDLANALFEDAVRVRFHTFY